MEIRQLRYFLAVFVHQSLTRAAEALYISQPALSRALKDLESECGVTLFDRTSSGVQPTAAANALFPHAKTTVQLAEDAAAVARGAGSTRESVDIGLAPGLSPDWLDDLLDRVGAAVPGAALAPVDLISAEQVRLVRSGRLDLGLVHESRPPGVITALMREERFGIAVAPGSPFFDLETLRLSDLHEVRVLSHARHQVSTTHDDVLAAAETAGVAPDWRFGAYTENARACARAVGADAALMAEATAHRLLGGWRWIPLIDPVVPIDTTLIRLEHSRAIVAEVAEALIQAAHPAASDAKMVAS